MTDQPTGTELTAREKQIIRLVSQGLTNREIGRALFLSHMTVKSHLQRIFRKTGAVSRAHLVLFAEVQGVPVAVLHDIRNRTAIPDNPLGTADWYRQEGALRVLDQLINQLITPQRQQQMTKFVHVPTVAEDLTSYYIDQARGGP